MSWIDLHTHINMIKQSSDDVLKRAQLNHVEKMVLIATEPGDLDVVYSLAQKYYPTFFCTLGIHPHDSKNYSDEVEAKMESMLNFKEVIGIGEIGLDYHYNHSPQDVQREVFRRQLRLAAKYKMPVEIHTRDAEQDTIEILKEFNGQVNGLLHCFTGTKWLAHEALKIGFDISLSGVCTFKNAEPLREVIRSLPVDRVHIETDAPFMTPAPHRGKENEPAMISFTAQKVSELFSLSENELSRQLKINAKRLFPKLLWP